MSALLNCLPAAQRARARLRMELSRMQARAKRMGLSQIAILASLAIMVRSCHITYLFGKSASHFFKKFSLRSNTVLSNLLLRYQSLNPTLRLPCPLYTRTARSVLLVTTPLEVALAWDSDSSCALCTSRPAVAKHAWWRKCQDACFSISTELSETAALALQAIVAGVAVVKNAALSRAIRRKDQEMNQLILMVSPCANAKPAPLPTRGPTFQNDGTCCVLS